ncbi:putative thioredoxin, partial [Lichtheimia hyalospora FSU 10163]
FNDKVLNSKIPVLFDFWAEWCGPCKMITPILNENSVEYENKVIIGKLNIDQNQDLPPKYEITGLPTLLLFKNKKVIAKKVGALSKGQLKEFLDINL